MSTQIFPWPSSRSSLTRLSISWSMENGGKDWRKPEQQSHWHQNIFVRPWLKLWKLRLRFGKDSGSTAATRNMSNSFEENKLGWGFNFLLLLVLYGNCWWLAIEARFHNYYFFNSDMFRLFLTIFNFRWEILQTHFIKLSKNGIGIAVSYQYQMAGN